jgi:hypothetical protein
MVSQLYRRCLMLARRIDQRMFSKRGNDDGVAVGRQRYLIAAMHDDVLTIECYPRAPRHDPQRPRRAFQGVDMILAQYAIVAHRRIAIYRIAHFCDIHVQSPVLRHHDY